MKSWQRNLLLAAAIATPLVILVVTNWRVNADGGTRANSFDPPQVEGGYAYAPGKADEVSHWIAKLIAAPYIHVVQIDIIDGRAPDGAYVKCALIYLWMIPGGGEGVWMVMVCTN